MKCPRRMEGPFRLPNEDKWRDDNTCSYCGSLNPDALMERIEAGDVELGPTDKSYKVYLKNIGFRKFKDSYRNCPRDAKCTGPDDCTHWVIEERDHSKFYFQHLSDDQRRHFIELHNQGKLKIGVPGYFYVAPFFATRVTK